MSPNRQDLICMLIGSLRRQGGGGLDSRGEGDTSEEATAVVQAGRWWLDLGGRAGGRQGSDSCVWEVEPAGFLKDRWGGGRKREEERRGTGVWA